MKELYTSNFYTKCGVFQNKYYTLINVKQNKSIPSMSHYTHSSCIFKLLIIVILNSLSLLFNSFQYFKKVRFFVSVVLNRYVTYLLCLLVLFLVYSLAITTDLFMVKRLLDSVVVHVFDDYLLVIVVCILHPATPERFQA